MKYLEKIDKLINEYKRVQKESIGDFIENNLDMDPEFFGSIYDTMIGNNKMIFTSIANQSLVELNSELIDLENQLTDIKEAIKRTMFFINWIPKDESTYPEIPDTSESSYSND